jgi:hypothetical protein
VIVVLALKLGVSPARAGATTYDISILLYQPHPWIADSVPNQAARIGPSRGGSYTVGKRVDGGDFSSDGFGNRAGQPAAARGVPKRQDHTGPYSLFVYGGLATRDRLVGFYNLDTVDTQMLAAGVTARLHRFNFGLEIEGEAGLARRFGQDDLWEGWIAAGVRWRDFPWNHIVKTTFGFAFAGLSYTTQVPPHETEYHDNKRSKLLYFLAPELTFALPEHPEVALMLRLHHRSGAYGVFPEGAANFVTAGLRFQY